MPKINVYLPDDLADAVRDTGVPVSAVCQRALEQAVRRIAAVRDSTLRDLSPDDMAALFPQFTGRAREVLTMAARQADGAPHIGTGHLLTAMIAEGTNLALHVLRAIEVDPALLAREVARQVEADGGDGESGEVAPRLSIMAAAAVQAAATEATSMGHNYVGCEHLLLGLVGEPDGVAGRVLRAAGAEARLTRRAVAAALAGYVHLRAQSPAAAQPPAADGQSALVAALQEQLRPLVARIERLEQAQR